MILKTALLILTRAIPGAAQVCTQSPPGLMAWWPGDGNARDVVGPNNGTLLNGTTFATRNVERIR